MRYDHRLVIQAIRGDDHIHPGGESETAGLCSDIGLDRASPGGRVLDLGSGFGGSARWISSSFGMRVTGLDLQWENCLLSAARNQGVQGFPPVFVCGDGRNMPFRDDTFQFALSWCVLGFVEDKMQVFEELSRVLVPGGRFGFDAYDVSQPGRYRSRKGGMAHVQSARRYAAQLEAAGFRVITYRNLGEYYGRSYRRFLEVASRRAPEIYSSMGRERVERALRRFGENIEQVLDGSKGGARFVAVNDVDG